MADLAGSRTEANLRSAFAFEAQAGLRFLFFAQQADVEGYPEVAALFRTIADGETGHALGHLDFLLDVGDPVTGRPIGDTEDNLASAEAGEQAEAADLYPDFAAAARDEGFDEIADWLEGLAAAEGQYAERLGSALARLRSDWPPG